MSSFESQNSDPPSPENRGEDASLWLERYGDTMYRFAMVRLRNADHAEEVVQETLLAALRSQENFRGDAQVSTWLLSILRFKVADHFRKQQRDREHRNEAEVDALEKPQPDESSTKTARWDEDPASQLENKEFWGVFQSCVDKLPEKLAEVHMLREINRQTPKEICKILQISPTNLSMRLHRSRLALRDCLQKNWFKDEEDETS